MGNSNCASPEKRRPAVSPLGASEDQILALLRGTDPLRSPDLRSLLQLQSTPTAAMVCEACKQGHWEALIFFHRRHGCDPHSSVKHEGCTAVEWSSAAQDENVAPSKKILKRQREKVRTYIRLTPARVVVSPGSTPPQRGPGQDDDDQDREDKILTMVLVAAFRFGDRSWLDRTLQGSDPGSAAVFRLLIEAIHAADTLLVNDLIAGGCHLERRVDANEIASGYQCWDSAIHHAVTSLSLRSRGVQGIVLRRLLERGNTPPNRRNRDGHTPITLAVLEGNLEAVQILITEMLVDIDFNVPIAVGRDMPFKEWATTSSARPNSMAEDPDGISLALSEMLTHKNTREVHSDDEVVCSSPGSFGSHELDRNEAKADVGEASEKYVYREEENASKETLTLENELSLSP